MKGESCGASLQVEEDDDTEVLYIAINQERNIAIN
jgi:hypothetical protein